MAGPEQTPPGAALSADVETRPKAVAAWLARLPYASPADAARQLVTALYGLNRHPLDGDARYALLALYRPALARAAAGLEGLLGEGGVPPQPQQRQLGALLRGLHSEHVFGCRQVLDTRPRRFGRASPKRIAGAAAQQMAALRDLQAACYLTYTGLPPGLWQDLHRLYAFAEASKHAEPARRAGSDGDDAQPADLIYRQALLLALADPPHMTHAELMQTRLYLDQLAGLAQLGAPPAGGGRGFLIRTDGDAPPSALAVGRAAGTLWLDTDALCRALHETMARRNGGRGPSGTGADEASLKLFRRLFKQWSGPARRSFRRYAASGGTVQLVAGISTIHRLLDGVGQAPRLDVADGTVAVADVGAPAAAAPIVVNATHWTVINDSAAGLALLGAPNAPLNLKAGDALALRADAGEWSLAVVRWVRVRDTDEGEIELGVERLAPRVRPLWLRALSGKRARTEPALLLPGLPALKQPDRLLLPRRVYHAGMDAGVCDAARRYTLTFGRLLEQTPSFDLVDFTLFEEARP